MAFLIGGKAFIPVIASIFGRAGDVVEKLFATVHVQVPEPGLTLLFGIGVAALGWRMGRKKPKE